jgi:hypothetical protein
MTSSNPPPSRAAPSLLSRQLIRLLGYATTVVLLACRAEVTRWPGEGAFAGFKRQGRWLYAFGKSQAALGELVRLDKMKPFQPGSPPPFTEAEVGQPKAALHPKPGHEYLVYENPNGRLWVGSEESSDGYVAYPVYFFPNDPDPAHFLAAPAMRHVDMAAADEVVLVYECGLAQANFVLNISHGHLVKVLWMGVNQLASRTDPRRCVD